ncbi:MAG: 3-mercaptopyruvate sulfurtransferase [Pseudohongiellaceae bacterium]|nr:3-mercaptopyruvate sulfurtransferase [Pseudohongiellaceae bacterium]
MQHSDLPAALIEVQWLQQAMREQHPRLIIMDASWHLPTANRNAESEWLYERIPGANFFDFDKRICDRDSSLPHMMPDAELFTSELRRLGVKKDSIVVFYCTAGTFTAPRAWWMMQAMGHQHCAVLNGGLEAWRKAGLPIETGQVTASRESGNFQAKPRASKISDQREVALATHAEDACIIDARSADRFFGKAPEPRPGLRAGHMPNACNLPFDRLIDNGYYRPIEELREALASLATPDKRLIATCGSGVTACVVAMAAHLCGYSDISVYDGSWAEWGAGDTTPISTQ